MVSQNGNSKSVIIIGAGIAGLSSGVFAQRNGYRSRIYEMHSLPGGLMTSWKREGYVIDGCIHWLTYSNPKSNYYPLWEEIGLIQDRQIFDPEIMFRYESKDGRTLNFYSNLDRLEEELLAAAPEDEKLIHEICDAGRKMLGFNPPIGEGTGMRGLLKSMEGTAHMVTLLPTLRKWGGMTMAELGALCKNPFLREALINIWYPEITAGAFIFTLSFAHDHTAGYPLGGSLPMALAVEKRYKDLGGEIHFSSRVEKILVENDRAVGVRLADGSEERADYVISAADGHATIFEMLEGRYIDDKIRKIYQEFPLFPAIILVGLGVKRTFNELPCITGGISIQLRQPIMMGEESVEKMGVMVYNFDPTFAPHGKTSITVVLDTHYPYWKELAGDPESYKAEKERIIDEVIFRLEQRFPGLADQVEMSDISTPLTFERYTGNWQASYRRISPHA